MVSLVKGLEEIRSGGLLGATAEVKIVPGPAWEEFPQNTIADLVSAASTRSLGEDVELESDSELLDADDWQRLSDAQGPMSAEMAAIFVDDTAAPEAVEALPSTENAPEVSNPVANDPNVIAVVLALTSAEPYTGDALVALQENLRALDLFNKDTHPTFGPGTSEGLAQFIETHSAILDDVQPWVFEGLRNNNAMDRIQNAAQPNVNNIVKMGAVEDFLANGPDGFNGDVTQLQIELTQLGHDVGKIDGVLGPKTTAGFVGYLDSSPSMFHDLSGKAIASVVQHGQFASLKNLVHDTDTGIFDVVSEKLQGIINLEGPHSEAMTADMQGLLALTGHNDMHNINGIGDGQTADLMAAFKENPNPVETMPAMAQDFKEAAPGDVPLPQSDAAIGVGLKFTEPVDYAVPEDFNFESPLLPPIDLSKP